MIRLSGVDKTFRGPAGPVRALCGVSFEVGPGEFVSVRGPSGCGKSTLLLIAGTLLSPTAGEVRIAGSDPYALGGGARAQFRARTVGFVFQQFHLLPYLSVMDNVLAPTVALELPDARERAVALIGEFGLSHRAGHVPSQLSTGEKQRVALARALLPGPSVLLADEPTGNLDEENGEAVLQALARFAEGGGAVMMVTHDPGAARVAHRALYLRDGELRANPD